MRLRMSSEHPETMDAATSNTPALKKFIWETKRV